MGPIIVVQQRRGYRALGGRSGQFGLLWEGNIRIAKHQFHISSTLVQNLDSIGLLSNDIRYIHHKITQGGS